ncbi:nitroreductase [Aciduricibacillus chroicocephali]|uniref:Nitroreductase n=1 Tax=Aciduricibacillus chroicocephali TaxID=3054939 RepID=A0ABY9KWT2_9BACI|nr:nitroreductase [Bacillaceae bacterium 44XB]
MNTGEKTALKKVIRERRSIKGGYTNKEVKEDTVIALLEEAVWAPTHGMRQPWRFIYVGADQLPTFAKKIASTYPEEIQENREAYLNEPNAILVIIMAAPEKQKQWDENFGAVASMIQNFSLLAWEEKLGVCWKTNPHIYNDQVRSILGVSEDEKIIGFIHLGYFDQNEDERERLPVRDKFKRFGE